MKVSILSALTVGLAAGTLAAPTKVERDLPTVTGVLSGIGTKVDALGSAIQAYSGGDVASVQQASDNLVSAINSGNSQVSGTSALSSTDALGLPGPVDTLKKKISTVISDLDNKKTLIVEAGKGAQTYNDLTEQKAAAEKLSDTIVSKVPESLQSLAGTVAGGISDAIEAGVKSWSDQASKGDAAQPQASPAAPAAAPKAAPTAAPAAPAAAPKPAASNDAPAAAGAAPVGGCVARY
ncbi:cell wall mannoprotein 1 family protein [Aspergillus brunneoviolaceus CBS 621.78]|uniref:Uncharacterized protein n=1 Tax=Aspergillus brunneoviolaceus CBS 621.78 TaxID=1450534 RepID=A0ACD1G8U5_9EURO|nr:hypothetical protein BO95DRAFT_496450 [Aspergillus brunneoviolaceus CBS 621.78]RAH45705.1 hypothetical protein BO95DRAFT_496450 [Aspergillus brunneoviolaceus CBS 621.78]